MLDFFSSDLIGKGREGICSKKVEIWSKKAVIWWESGQERLKSGQKRGPPQKLPQPNLTVGLNKFLSGVARLGRVRHGSATKHASVCKVLESRMFHAFFQLSS